MFLALRDIFPAPTDSYEERPSGESALLAFAVSAAGTLLEGSTVLSEGAWATARALDPGPESPRWLDGFESLAVEFAMQQEEMYLRGEDGVPKLVVLGWAELLETLAAAEAALGVTKALAPSGIRVSSEIVARRSADTVEHDFLNSFIADDLARVAAAAQRGEVGAGLRDYLRPNADLDKTHRGLRAGTIHTAQGKEADIVILVLGSEPAREGARAWAASKPNLLNVAVSRARRRLYVIGDREAWRRQRYFDLPADRLPHDPRT